MRNLTISLILILALSSCYQPQRDCAAFKEGEFSFSSTIDGVEKTTIFTRKNDIEIDIFNNKVDTSSVRWLNDCEYVLKKLNPVSKSEEKSIHIKILSTTDNSYTFEYSVVGANKKSKGTASKTN